MTISTVFKSTEACVRHNRIDVWTLPFETLRKNSYFDLNTLSKDEQARQSAFFVAQFAQDYRLGRALLRFLLSPYIQTSPGDIQFHYSEHGKPYLSNGPAFNLSHCDRMIVVAIAEADFKGHIGVDVEPRIVNEDYLHLPKICFSTSEREQLAEFSTQSSLQAAFTRGWSRKEAIVKAIGMGLSAPLQSFDVSLAAVESSHPNQPSPIPADLSALTLNHCQPYDLGTKMQCELSLAVVQSELFTKKSHRIELHDQLPSS